MSAAGSFRVDASRWPIVVHTIEGFLSNAQIDAYTEEGTRHLLRGEPYVVILDFRLLTRTSAYARARSAEWQQTYREALQQTCRGTVFLPGSILMRFVTMTVLLVTKPPMPYRISDNLEDALAWAKASLV